MIISNSYFKGIINIPNATDTAPNSNLLGNSVNLDLFIDEFERDILTKCLGSSLFNDFLKELDNNTSNKLKTTADVRWNYLLNGREYNMNGKPMIWRGLIFKDGSLNRSLIAYYVFCQFLRNNIFNYSGTGVVRESSKNALAVSSDPLYVSSYRKFCELTEFSKHNNGLRSLYDFIDDMNKTDNMYPDWNAERFENMNILGV